MKADYKKRLIAIQKELHEFTQEFQCWFDEHEGDWEYSPAGEKASEELYSLETAENELASVTNYEIQD